MKHWDVFEIDYDSDCGLMEMDNDCIGDEDDDVDSCGGDDSADEQVGDDELCTFTKTHKEFVNQHWYHCHTCGMVDGEGVCTICAKVCHREHDISYRYDNKW